MSCRTLFFPTNSIVSQQCVLCDGAALEVASVGNDGALGVGLFLGGETATNFAIVRGAGYGYQLTCERLREEFGRHGELMQILLRYTQALLIQTAQVAACNRHHSVEQQLCRWLLLSLDRLGSRRVAVTQELIALMLGVRREGITDAAGKLQKLGIIKYRRGQITVLDRPQLEQHSCECYAVVKRETDRLLRRPVPGRFEGPARAPTQIAPENAGNFGNPEIEYAPRPKQLPLVAHCRDTEA